MQALPLLELPDLRFSFPLSLSSLPFFNPDVEEAGLPASVKLWRSQIRDHDALVICSPEYAHGVPGAFKNALDWLVGGVELTGKPIAVLQTSFPSTTAHLALVEILTVLGAHVLPEASVALTLRGLKLDARGIAVDPTLSTLLRTSMQSLAAAVTVRAR